ncbi:MAG: VCBS repeat-containing protein, partial [Chlorobi bacterium]|nr:VCBS repeat-containing protein [Chlorobiota bacterium]
FVDGEYKLIATATDTDTNRYNSFGLVPGFAFGDFDNDGKQELCHSNRYGNMRIYQYENDHFTMEMIDTVDISGSEQYVCSADIDGDGTPEIVIGSFGTQIPFDNYDDGKPLWTFRIWKSDGANNYSVIWENHFHGVRGSSTYKNGLSSGNIDNKAGDEIIISLFPNLFVFKWDEAKQDMKPLWVYPASYANSAIVYDFDGNGVNEIGFTTFGNTSFYEYNTADMPSPPADLQAYAIDGSSAQLNWKAADDADSYEILEMTKTETGYTGKQIGVTNETELLITNLSNNTHYEYVARSINNSTTERFSDISNFADVYTHDPIFAELATVNNEHIIILEYSG